MVIKGNLRHLYTVGESMLPEIANVFTKSANDLVATNDAAVTAFSRTVDDPNPALDSAVEYGESFKAWEEYRNTIYDILVKNSNAMTNAAEFIIGAADAYAYQDGYNAEEIEDVKDDVGIDEDPEINPNNRA